MTMVITTERDGIAKLIQVELEGDVWRDFPFPSIVCQDGNRSSMTQCQKTKIKKLNKTDNSKYSLLAKKGFRDGKYGILFWSGVFWWSADPSLGLFGGMIKAELPEWGLAAGVVFCHIPWSPALRTETHPKGLLISKSTQSVSSGS